jgi:hypothetical protein
MLSKLRKPVPDRDRIVIIDDSGSADIATVFDIDDQAIYAESPTQDYSIPIADVISYVGPSGRIYILKADADYVGDTQRLAALEKSIVLRQITHFSKPAEPEGSGINIRSILMYAMIGILLLAVVFK